MTSPLMTLEVATLQGTHVIDEGREHAAHSSALCDRSDPVWFQANLPAPSFISFCLLLVSAFD